MENNTTQLKKFTPETMKEIVYVTWPTLAPAGDKAAWVDWKGDMKSGLFSSKIHLMEIYYKMRQAQRVWTQLEKNLF